MSYQALEWVGPMTKERWGRLIEQQNAEVGSSLVWLPNNRPLELANEYLRVVEWAQHLERELIKSTQLLADLNVRIGDLDPTTLNGQKKQNEQALATSPTERKKAELASART